MGRHPYHTPDMIVMMRRLNQGSTSRSTSAIPWRHRLGSSERREFVLTEIRRPGMAQRERTRGSELDVQRAVHTARNPRESKFGECLLSVNTKEDPVLKSRLKGISTEMRRMEFRMKQLKQHFVKNNPCLNHEPLILVERQASPTVKARAKVIVEGGEDPADVKKPGYMRPLKSRCRTPSTLTTIDAFTLNTRKKRNVWEEAMDERDPPSFKSAVRPCARLTRREMTTLHLGWDAHKPKVDAATGTCSTVAQPPSGKKPDKPSYPTATTPAPSQPETTPFISQLPLRKDLARTSDGRLLENAFLDQLLALNGSCKDPGGGRHAGGGGAAKGKSGDVFITEEERARVNLLYGVHVLGHGLSTTYGVDGGGQEDGEDDDDLASELIPSPLSVKEASAFGSSQALAADRSLRPSPSPASHVVVVVAKPGSSSGGGGTLLRHVPSGSPFTATPTRSTDLSKNSVLVVKQERRRKVAIRETPIFITD